MEKGEVCRICGNREQPNDADRCPVCWMEWEWHYKLRIVLWAQEMARNLAKGKKKYYNTHA